MAACRDDQTAEGYQNGGAYTLGLVRSWRAGHIESYEQWHQAAARNVALSGAAQNPTLTWHRAGDAFKQSPPMLGLMEG